MSAQPHALSNTDSQLPRQLLRRGPLRVVTAASLFDGHDAAINIMRRLIQGKGAEVIHLGHNRSVDEVVRAVLQEDADAVAISSYQGGHMEYFRYLVDRLREEGLAHVRVFGGGGGTITPEEIAELQAYGVERIYHPNDGMQLGLDAMIQDLVDRALAARQPQPLPTLDQPLDAAGLALSLTALQEEKLSATALPPVRDIPVIGITGTGGAGKSSVTDELLLRFRRQAPDLRIALLAVDPTRRKTGGALLGDRIRMNALDDGIFMRSLATRRQNSATNALLADSIRLLKTQPFDLILVETAGIGQSDSEIVDLVDLPIYVMTSEYGAASQLEKIDMLDFAELVVLNKADRQGSLDALRDIRKQWKRNRLAFDLPDAEVPVFPTMASQFNNPGMNRLFTHLAHWLAERGVSALDGLPPLEPVADEALVKRGEVIIPSERKRYLAEIAEQGRAFDHRLRGWIATARSLQQLWSVLQSLDAHAPAAWQPYPETVEDAADATLQTLRQRYMAALEQLPGEVIACLKNWPERRAAYEAETQSYQVRGREITVENTVQSLAGMAIRKVAVPRFEDWGEQLRFLFRENLPGYFPFTAGVYPFRRKGEDPTRMFAGEGTPERTNRRFHYLSSGSPAKRLSTAFDSVTLYGENPASRPDIYGKIGNSGVSIATLDDMKKLYSGFDLCSPGTSVSMTINGPAPVILAMFMNTAIDQQVEKHLKESGQWAEAEKRIRKLRGDYPVAYHGELPAGNDGLGLGLLGVTGDQLLEPETYQRIREATLRQVRGTVQADILKEDQAQNTCIFSTPFALRMMGDVQEWFIDHQVRNYYSVSVSGYHIAEAGANPITQLAFTLANGFTLVEYYLARGMHIDDFAPNLSFFFSNGMDPEYAVIGRVARRIWARAMKERYGASERSQKLKYHIQTSGRSLHAQEMQFNDIRTTLQALYALFDNCNSLHTNAYDEALTTPTEASVRRAMAIQMIINHELGLNQCENPWQGSFIIDELTDLVEEAVYREFERLSERGGVLGAMETMYQRGRIQEESLFYEQKKHDGSLPIIGVNTFQGKDSEALPEVELMRSTSMEKQQQIEALEAFHRHHAPCVQAELQQLQQRALQGQNLFDGLMQAVRHASLGQITALLYRVGGAYRRNM